MNRRVNAIMGRTSATRTHSSFPIVIRWSRWHCPKGVRLPQPGIYLGELFCDAQWVADTTVLLQ
jgi:hypothetical protein